MQSATGQYGTHAGEPAHPVQHSVMIASSFGFFFRGVAIPSDFGSILTTVGVMSGLCHICRLQEASAVARRQDRDRSQPAPLSTSVEAPASARSSSASKRPPIRFEAFPPTPKLTVIAALGPVFGA